MHDVAIAYEEMGRRIAYWCRREWPANTVQRTAQAFDCDERTARRWVNEGQFPAGKFFAAMIKRFGQSFALFVLEPVGGQWCTEARIKAEIAETKNRLDALEEKLRGAA